MRHAAWRHLLLAWRAVWRSAPGQVLLLVAVTGVLGLAPAATTWLTKELVDALVGRATLAAITPPAVGLATTGLLIAVLPHLTLYLGGEINRRCERLLTDELYGAVNGFNGLGRFEDPHMLDDLQMAQRAAAGATGPATTGVVALGKDVVTLVSLLVTLWVLAPVMAGVVLVSGLPLLVAQALLSRQHVRNLVRMTPRARRQHFYGALITEPHAAKEVRLLGLGATFQRRMLDELRTVHDGEHGMERRRLRVQGLLALLGALVASGGLVWAVLLAVRGELSVGGVMAFVAALAAAQAAMTGLVNRLVHAHEALLTFRYHADVLTLQDDLAPPTRPTSLPPLRRGVEFHNVWFRYDRGHPWVLRGLDLDIPSGRSVALVGLNGAGKSTMVKLLCRFYDPQVGRITWDGVDIRDVPVADLRNCVGAVFQDFMRYDLTAAENIGLGDLARSADADAIRDAARAAGLHEKLESLPQGYHTALTRTFFSAQEKAEHGVLLSGGEWQRLALARAMMRVDRDVLVLDEPSSGLDAEAEHDLHTRLRTARRGRTNLMISHRLATVRAADRIVVLADGKVVEEGTHAELIERKGRYEHLFSLQARGYALEQADPVRR